MTDKKEGGYVRVNEPTKVAITKMAARLSDKQGRRVSADEALWWMFNTYMPELAREAESMGGDNGQPKQQSTKGDA